MKIKMMKQLESFNQWKPKTIDDWYKVRLACKPTSSSSLERSKEKKKKLIKSNWFIYQIHFQCQLEFHIIYRVDVSAVCWQLTIFDISWFGFDKHFSINKWTLNVHNIEMWCPIRVTFLCDVWLDLNELKLNIKMTESNEQNKRIFASHLLSETEN